MQHRHGASCVLLNRNTILVCGGIVDVRFNKALSTCEQIDLSSHEISPFKSTLNEHATHTSNTVIYTLPLKFSSLIVCMIQA